MTTFVDTKLHSEIAEALAKALAIIEPSDLARVISNIQPCGVTGKIGRDEIVIGLGEYCDVWPESIRDHCESAEIIHFLGAEVEVV